MRGGSFLRKPLPHVPAETEEEAIQRLRDAKTTGELLSVWNLDCDRYRGAERERLQDEYAVALSLLGALHP